METTLSNLWNVVGPTLVTVLLAVLLILGRDVWKRVRATEQRGIIRSIVRAAEQVLGSYTGAQKREWVIAQLKAIYPNLKINDGLLWTLIEEAVYDMNAERPAPPTVAPASTPRRRGGAAGTTDTLTGR